MNGLGVLMITAMLVALSARGRAQSTAKEIKTAKEEDCETPNQHHSRLPSQSRFAANAASCQQSFTPAALWWLLDRRGVRPVDSRRPFATAALFVLEEMGSFTAMEPRWPGDGRDAFQQWLRALSQPTACHRPESARMG